METLTKNALQLLDERYLLKNAKGQTIENPNQLFHRVAKFVSRCEKKHPITWETKFYKVMSTLKFLPNSPTLMNAGCNNGQLSACFVLPIEDSLESIFTTLKNAALIHQSGGGTGFNFSKLRPKDDMVSSNSGTSSGAVAFIKIYDAATAHVKQGGKRRGANMGIMNVDHPDIIEFIQSKSSKKTIENFNISVGITNDFMAALEGNSLWKLINPRTGMVTKTVKAKTIWNLIIKEAWKTGDPGLVFLDTINDKNPTPELGNIETTNPCGEVPLLDNESCNLGSINLSKMTCRIADKNEINWKELATTVHLAIRFLDNIITVNHYLISDVKTRTLANRKVGLGVMGWAELLILLELPYESDEALRLGETLMEFIKNESYNASEAIAKEKGVFPEWERSVFFPHRKMRNATCNSIAPTGSISIIANTSYSIEPLFALAYQRVGILGGKSQIEVNSLFLQKMKELNLWSETLEQDVYETGSIQNSEHLPAPIKSLFKTSLEISWKYHLLHQKSFQKFTDNAVSKTINLPQSSRVEDVSDIYMTAWRYQLKGITIYRYGSKDNQVLQRCNLNNNLNC